MLTIQLERKELTTSMYDMIVIAIIGLHSLYRAHHPKFGDTHNGKVSRFFGTFLKDFFIAILVTAVLYVGMILLGAAAPFFMMSAIFRGLGNLGY